MYAQGLFSLEDLSDCLSEIEPELIRFPSLNPETLKRRINNFTEQTLSEGS